MSRAGRKTKRLSRTKASHTVSTLSVVDYIYRRLTGDTTGRAPIGRVESLTIAKARR